jgi:4-hydroxybenzoate polyprenyltransferase
MQLGPFYLLGLGVVFALLLYEHWLLRGGDLAKLDAAFFNMNGYISIAIFIFTLFDVLAR